MCIHCVKNKRVAVSTFIFDANSTPNKASASSAGQTPSRALLNTPALARTRKHTSDCVTTIIRLRPLRSHISNKAPKITVNEHGDSVIVDQRAIPSRKNKTEFNFDQVCGPETTQQEMFDLAGQPIADSCLKGYNGTIFAYGMFNNPTPIHLFSPARK